MENETKKIDEKLKNELLAVLPKDKKIAKLTTSTKLVLAKLINLQQTQYFDENECVFASYDFLANELLISKKTAQRAIATLLSLGLIVKCESTHGKAQSYRVICVCGQNVVKTNEPELRIKINQFETELFELKAVVANILKNISIEKTKIKKDSVGYVPKTHINNFIPISYNEMLRVITTTQTCQGVYGLDNANKFVCVKIDENGRQILE